MHKSKMFFNETIQTNLHFPRISQGVDEVFAQMKYGTIEDIHNLKINAQEHL